MHARHALLPVLTLLAACPPGGSETATDSWLTTSVMTTVNELTLTIPTGVAETSLMTTTLGKVTEGTSSGATETGATETGATGTSATQTGATETGATGTGSSSGASATASSTGLPPSCEDGVHNQDETDVDCGGGCKACPDGQGCLGPEDCESRRCEQGVCEPECRADADCAFLVGPCVSATCNELTKQCEKQIKTEGTFCEDGDLCTTSSWCTSGVCSGEVTIDCSAFDSACGTGTCDPQTGKCSAVPIPGTEGMPCDDGFACTPADQCSAGFCGPGGPGFAFFEDFMTPHPGWVLGPTWEIGKAKLSPQGGTGGADPAADHTLTNDERLAGVLIGGLSQGSAFPKTCLTTPPIDTTTGKEVWVTFWRHLHTDFFPFVRNQIEVFDGIDWIEVELGYNNPGVNDRNWQQIYFDLSLYSHEALRVRFCYERKSGADSFAGWSIDDVTVGPYACTPE